MHPPNDWMRAAGLVPGTGSAAGTHANAPGAGLVLPPSLPAPNFSLPIPVSPSGDRNPLRSPWTWALPGLGVGVRNEGGGGGESGAAAWLPPPSSFASGAAPPPPLPPSLKTRLPESVLPIRPPCPLVTREGSASAGLAAEGEARGAGSGLGRAPPSPATPLGGSLSSAAAGRDGGGSEDGEAEAAARVGHSAL